MNYGTYKNISISNNGNKIIQYLSLEHLLCVKLLPWLRYLESHLAAVSLLHAESAFTIESWQPGLPFICPIKSLEQKHAQI